MDSIHVALDRIQLPGDIKLQRTLRYVVQLCGLEEEASLSELLPPGASSRVVLHMMFPTYNNKFIMCPQMMFRSKHEMVK